MKVLVALPGPPRREGGAAARCHIGLLRGLSAHGVDVHTVCARLIARTTGQPILPDAPDAPDDLHVEQVPVPLLPTGLRGAIERATRPMQEFGRNQIGPLISDRAGAFDVVHLEETQMTYCADQTSTPTVIHLHNLLRFDLDLLPWRRYFIHALERRLAEQGAFRRHRRFIASSPVVADVIRAEVSGADITMAPLTIDPELYPRAPLDGPPTAGIIGNASWPVTNRSMRELVERVWPLVRRAVPDARLLIAGRALDGGSRIGLDITTAREMGIEVVGEVPSALGFLHRLSVLVYPLSRGSGMKLKVLESIAAGLPVVTTAFGAEGINADGGIVVEAEDRALADATASILSDAAERAQRGSLARKAFLDRYSPVPATEPLVDLYRRIAQSQP